MPDRYASHAAGLESPAARGFAITPSDGASLPETTRAIYVGTAGDLTVVLASGDQLSFLNLPSATVLPIRAIAVKASGTTATALLGLL
jgi:hypothetical protein